MKLNKHYKKFFEVGNNRYYVLPYDEDLFVATESFIATPHQNLFRKNKTITQGLKLLQLTAPISMLFDEMLGMMIENEDPDFPDMSTYKLVDNIELRKRIENSYKTVIEEQINSMVEDFNKWTADFIDRNPNISDDEFEKIIEVNRKRLEDGIAYFKKCSPLNNLIFKKPTNRDNLVVKKMLDTNIEFLYTQKVGANLDITYLYELDKYGTVTIYKLQIVKGVVKSIETFVYNREIISELVTYIANNRL